MRRKDRERDESFALSVADNCKYAVVSMIDTVGKPYCVPLSIARDDNLIYFHCALDGFKVDCLNKNNDVCISCVGHTKNIPEEFTTEYESAIIRGKAFEVTESEEKIHALKLICERYAKSNMAEFGSAIERSLSRTGIWKIEIDEITGKCKSMHN
ncbi:MAG: pyridoxamine 5'-phosphate oxidase family protein [Clostridia bacterium]|nr:pyridoxamine 5'-phosphate oxidase family protein [Clostridia bacterium]